MLPARDTSTPTRTDLKLASFNLRNGRAFDGWNSWPFRRGATAEVVRALDADILGLQEAYRLQLCSLRRRVPGYVAVGDGRNRKSRGEHTPVLTRGRVESHVTRWFDVPGARFPRIATTARVVVHGVELSFTSTHLDEASSSRRRASLEQLVEWISAEPGPHVVVGDFNATLDDPMFESFAGVGLRSALQVDAPGTSHHFTGRYDGRRIDHIFVPHDTEVVAAYVDHTNGRASDHWPVVATIRL
jgi:endonuclease/exonuclease/phosphatase family metal-dependent hydrolase